MWLLAQPYPFVPPFPHVAPASSMQIKQDLTSEVSNKASIGAPSYCLICSDARRLDITFGYDVGRMRDQPSHYGVVIGHFGTDATLELELESSRLPLYALDRALGMPICVFVSFRSQLDDDASLAQLLHQGSQSRNRALLVVP